MVFISHGKSRADINPKGAYLSSLALAGIEVIKPSKDGYPTHGGAAVLIPFGGRVRDATYSYNGRSYTLPRNNGQNSIHGFLKDVEWSVANVESNEVTLFCDMEREDYPSSIHSEITYSLEEDRFTNHTSVTNTGEAAVPLVIGFHPYYITGDSWTISCEDRLKKLNFRDEYFPDGTVEDVDYNSLDDMSRMNFDNCYYGGGEITLKGKDRTLSIKRENMDYIVIFNGSYAEGMSVAIEPMTGAPDAFNNGIGLVDLPPGQVYSCGYSVELEQWPSKE